MKEIEFFETSLEEIKDLKKEIELFKKHMKELFSISKLLKFERSIGKNFTLENMKEFQIYLQQFFFERVKKLKFCDSETKDYFRVLRLAYQGISLYLKENATIEEFQNGLDYYKEERERIQNQT